MNTIEIQRLRRRYDLRAEGANVRDAVQNSEYPMRSAVLHASTQCMTKKDRLFFRQGYYFRAGENHVRG